MTRFNIYVLFDRILAEMAAIKVKALSVASLNM